MINEDKEYIYIVQANEYYKIGRTRNIKTRIRDIECNNPYDIFLVHKFEADKGPEAEKLLHRIFKHKRVNREWFNLSVSDINFLTTIESYERRSFVWATIPIIILPHQQKAKKFVTKDYKGKEITVTEKQIYDFLQTAWRKQEKGERGLSINYWTKAHRPRLQIVTYYTIVKILTDIEAIINRKQGTMGQLVLPPQQAMNIIMQRIDYIEV